MNKIEPPKEPTQEKPEQPEWEKEFDKKWEGTPPMKKKTRDLIIDRLISFFWSSLFIIIISLTIWVL